MTLALRDYQTAAIAASEEALARGVARQLVALPTGTGKTVIFSELARRRAEAPTLVLAHRDELLGQAEDKIRHVAPELAMSIGRVQADRDDVAAPVVVASVQTLSRPRRLARLPRRFGTAVVDEAHHATAESYRRILDHVDADLVIGFTATPERHDKTRLRDVFDEIVYARSLLDMIRAGYLCELVGTRIEIGGLNLGRVKVSRGDYQAGDLGRAMEHAHAPEQTAAAMAEHAADRKSIVFVPTVELAGQTAEAIAGAGIPAAWISGETPTEERHAALADLAAGRVRALVNVNVLSEGFDEPSIDCVVMAAPTRSRIAYVQRVGRGTRIHPGKGDCLVLDLVGVTRDLKLQSVPALFDLDPEEVADGEPVTQAVDRAEAARASAAQLAAMRAERAELFGRAELRWIQVGSRWVIGAGGDEILALDPAGPDEWRVLHVRDSGAKILAGNLDLGYAQGAAEEAVRNRGAASFARANASWRGREVSRGQAGKLRRLGATRIPATRGEAADEITRLVGERLCRRLDAALRLQAEDAGAVTDGEAPAEEPTIAGVR